MSWCEDSNFEADRPAFTARAIALGIVVVAALAGGCGDGGFRPMYASTEGNPKLEAKLAAVEISPIGGKTGQRLRNELIFQSTGGNAPAPPAYRLEVAIRESVGATLVKTTGESASSIYNLDSSFKLVDIATKKVIFEGSSSSRASFDRFPTIYSNVRASDDAANRAAKTMADEIKSRVAAFLSNNRV